MADWRQTSFRVPSTVLQRLKHQAVTEETTLSQLLNRLINQYLDSVQTPETRDLHAAARREENSK